ncbi:MAG TPA: fibronectin type III domain-containing protein, partial [Terriglobales bacterium]|nr:fibronectin type III domain-containing protein [Terriglobales bacterium]
NSIVEMWIAHDGQPARLVTNMADAALVNNLSGGASGKYGKISLSAYNTNMSGSLVNTAVWFDDLVVSTRRVPDPNVATPNAPDSLALSNFTSSSVTVNWRVNSQNGTAQDDTGFLVERCTGTATSCFPNPQSGFAQIGTTATGASSFVDSTAVRGTTYTYRLRARNAAGNSGYAAAICFNGGTTCGGTVTVP